MEDGELLLESWRETRFQNNFYLESYEDMKKRLRLLILISSLFITIPLSSEYILGRILKNGILLGIFISGMIILMFSILSMILIFKRDKLKLPFTGNIYKKMGSYANTSITKGIIIEYNKDIDYNLGKLDKKWGKFLLIENFIIFGLFILFVAIIVALF